MKTFLFAAAAALALSVGVAQAETRKDAMHDTMTQTDPMRAGDRMAAKDAAGQKPMAHAMASGWQAYTGLAGGGG